jgi:hypothetical protein
MAGSRFEVAYGIYMCELYVLLQIFRIVSKRLLLGRFAAPAKPSPQPKTRCETRLAVEVTYQGSAGRGSVKDGIAGRNMQRRSSRAVAIPGCGCLVEGEKALDLKCSTRMLQMRRA